MPSDLSDKARAMLDLRPLRPLCERVLSAIEQAATDIEAGTSTQEGVTLREVAKRGTDASLDEWYAAFCRLSMRGVIKSNGYRAVPITAKIGAVPDFACQEPIYTMKEETCTSSEP